MATLLLLSKNIKRTRMIAITKALEKDIPLLVKIGKQTFIESHGKSASPSVIDQYIAKTYNNDTISNELSDTKNIYHILSYKEKAAGFSKIIFDTPHVNIPLQHVTKLERIYLLKEFYELELGLELLNYTIALSQQNNQAGMWLFVWKENKRAVSFYTKCGFKIIGSHDFKLSDDHANPNHQMLLEY